MRHLEQKQLCFVFLAIYKMYKCAHIWNSTIKFLSTLSFFYYYYYLPFLHECIHLIKVDVRLFFFLPALHIPLHYVPHADV